MKTTIGDKTFNLSPSFRLSTRPEKKLGTEQQWDSAESALHEALYSRLFRS